MKRSHDVERRHDARLRLELGLASLAGILLCCGTDGALDMILTDDCRYPWQWLVQDRPAPQVSPTEKLVTLALLLLGSLFAWLAHRIHARPPRARARAAATA